MTQFTANEVRDAITWKYGDKSTRISAMLNAFADLLEAQEKAMPVMVVNHVSSAEHDLPIGMKLYTHLQPAQDAALYQELLMAVSKKFPNESRHETALRYIKQTELQSCEPKCDAAMAKESDHDQRLRRTVP